MEITSIEIKNYRSIKDLIKIPICTIGGKKCFVFLGMNESGKSNILNAIALRDTTREVEYEKDCNKEAKKANEAITVVYNLSCGFSFYKKKFIEDGFPSTLVDSMELSSIERGVSINEGKPRNDYFHLYLKDKKIFSSYIYQKSSKKILELKSVYSGEGTVTEDNIAQLIGEDYTLLDKTGVESVIEEDYKSLLDQNTPDVIYWKSSEEYLISDAIDLNQFKEDYNKSVPLRNIFKIGGVKDIKAMIELIAKDTEEKQELEEKLSEAITKYINKVWKEHKVNIKVRIEEMSCTVSVEDKDNTKPKYQMSQRSDGFKQFISILLNLSAENETQQLKNKIIILDEPEVHLHPSGIKYLRDELLNIAVNNVVIVASHSIYMVDRKNLDRHFSVVKNKSITNIHQIQRDNPYQEEVVYEALGTSIYEHIEPNILLLEGKTDKDLFDVFTSKFKADIKPIHLGTISADGVANVPKYIKFFGGKLVNGFVLVDSDKDGKKVRDAIIKDNKNFNNKNTFLIDDITKSKKDGTLEDLLPVTTLIECVKNRYEIDIELDKSKPVTAQIKEKLKSLRKIGPNDNLDDLKGDIARKIIEDVKSKRNTKEDIKKTYKHYYEFVIEAHKKLKTF